MHLHSSLARGASRGAAASLTRSAASGGLIPQFSQPFSLASAACSSADGVVSVGPVQPGDAAAFDRVIGARQSCRRFDASRDVDLTLMRRIMELTLRAPASFNLSPYVVVLAHDMESRKRLADSMIGEGNAQRVLQAPLTAVFAADIEPARLIAETVQMERAAGKSERYCRGLQSDAGAILNGPIVDLPPCDDSSRNNSASGTSRPRTRDQQQDRDRERNVNMISGHLHSWAQNLKKTAATAASVALGDTWAPVPTINTSEGWSFKNTSLACAYYMMACSAYGLATHPMEGFDARLVCKALNVPWPRYSVPMVIPTGYTHSEGQGAASPSHAPSEGPFLPPTGASPRPPFERMVRLNSFGQPFPASSVATNGGGPLR